MPDRQLMKIDPLEQFLTQVTTALAEQRFVKLVFGAYRGDIPGLQKVLVRRIEIKDKPHLQLIWRYDKKDRAENHPLAEAAQALRECWNYGFHSARLFALDHDWQLEAAPHRPLRLHKAPATFHQLPDNRHDHQKAQLLQPYQPWWRGLGLTAATGRILSAKQAKWRQIQSFVQILRPYLSVMATPNPDAPCWRVLDMGCGKGYLTFALAEFFLTMPPVAVQLTGIELRTELVEQTNLLARQCGFGPESQIRLQFAQGCIADCRLPCDLLIALHACNTATDEAILHGVSQSARWIVCSPCCHQEVRPQLTAPSPWQGLFQQGILLERFAEWLTDALRALYLESQGYAVKVVEFVPDEHTPRNLLLIGEKSPEHQRREAARREADQLRQMFGLQRQRLWTQS